jgi:hypothetical protein
VSIGGRGRGGGGHGVGVFGGAEEWHCVGFYLVSIGAVSVIIGGSWYKCGVLFEM